MSKKSALPPAIFCRGWSLKEQTEVKQSKESVAGGGGRGKGLSFEGQSQAEGVCSLVCAGLMAQGHVRGSRGCWPLQRGEPTFPILHHIPWLMSAGLGRARGTAHRSTGLVLVTPAAQANLHPPLDHTAGPSPPSPHSGSG